MKQMVGVMVGLLALVGCGYDPDTGRAEAAHEEECPPEERCEEPVGLCRMTGGGQIQVGDGGDFPDSYGGNAAWRRGEFIGEWNHVTHDGLHFHGHEITSIECFGAPGNEEPPSAGFDYIVFQGIGDIGEYEDCDFEVRVGDYGEGGPAFDTDTYSIWISCDGGGFVYETPVDQEILHGNLQIHELPPGFLN